MLQDFEQPRSATIKPGLGPHHIETSSEAKSQFYRSKNFSWMLFDACLVDSIEGTNLAELVFIVWFHGLGGEPSRAQISQYGIQFMSL